MKTDLTPATQVPLLRAALDGLLTAPVGNSRAAFAEREKRRSQALKIWVETAPADLKAAALKNAQERDPSCDTYEEAIRRFGTVLLSEVSEN